MKRFALLMVCLLALAAPAFGQIEGKVGDISAYADDQGSNCNITAPGGGGLVTVFVVHKFSDGGGATGARFKGVAPGGLSFVAFNTPFVPIGNFSQDLSLGYGLCITETTSLGSALYVNATAPAACSLLTIAAADNFANPIATDCLFGEYTVKTGSAIMNPTGACQCNIATQPSTWGRVKSLYR
jgi:hypothetical protein